MKASQSNNLRATPIPDKVAQHEGMSAKMDTTIVPFELTLAAAPAMHYGVFKYGRNNYRAGLPLEAYINSCKNHLAAMERGERNDPESGLPHFMHLASCVAMMAENVLNDRTMPYIPTEYQVLYLDSISRQVKSELAGAGELWAKVQE